VSKKPNGLKVQALPEQLGAFTRLPLLVEKNGSQSGIHNRIKTGDFVFL
jgi:hypothetical protein